MRPYGTGRDVKEDDANIKLTGNPFSEIVSDRDTFLFGDTQISFDSCGIDKRLCEALEENGMPVATAIQSKAIEAIQSGRDVIVGAETGSGKTLAYLIPLIQKYLVTGRKSFTVTRGGDEDGVGGDTVTVNYPFAVIMAPNKELCNQVQRMADKIIGKLKDKGVDLMIGQSLNASSCIICRTLHTFRLQI
jgi:superfamily II DNA/RNA helicase